MFGLFSRKKLQSRAEDLLIKAEVYAESANKTENFDSYMDDYDVILASFKELVDISKKIKLKGIHGNPEEDYINLKKDYQINIRDALEREYKYILRISKNECRADRGKLEAICSLYKESIDKYCDRFNIETSEYADELLKNLSTILHISFDDYMENDVNLHMLDFDSLGGLEFEYWCANLLRYNGFKNVTVTRGSGDQGVDLTAEKDDIFYAIQCKCYSSNLGNTPIQEVYAGKNMYHCQVAAVMTNRYFTKSAYELAINTGVLLWDRDKLLTMLQNMYNQTTNS